MKKIIPVVALLLVGACSPMYTKGEVAYDFVGCHEVVKNPNEGETAFFILPGLINLHPGDKLYFKQVNKLTLEVGSVKTGKKCND